MQKLKVGVNSKTTAAMKNLFKKTMLFAAAAMAFASCSNDGINDVATLPGVEVTINATTTEARSVFGELDGTTYPTLWEGTEEWNTFVNSQIKKANNNEITFSDDKTSAVAKPDYGSITAAENYTLRAISPYSQNNGYNNGFIINIPAAQAPTATSCDAAAQVLVAESEPQAEPTNFNITFKHATAYAFFSFTNLNLDGATINNVTVESEVPFVGKFNYDYANESVTDNNATSLITLDTNTAENLWLACAPVNVSGKKLTFTINTTNGPLKKEVTMPAGKGEFKSGVVATFTVNMSDIEFEKSVKYELVTDASELAVGDEIIIAAETANYAISTTQSTNNRAATAIVKDGNYIVDPGTDVEIITLEAGTSAGTFAFKANAGYLYAASSSGNHLKTKATKDVNGSWTITISNGTTSVVATGSSNRNVMRYNYNNGSPLFACYSSATQNAVAIYKLPSTKPVIAAASATAPIVGGEGQIATYTLKNIETDDIVIDSFDGNITEATKTADGTITYNISANTNKGAKVSTIVLSSPSTSATATISVTQDAPVFTVTPASLTFEATANSTATFKVTSTYAATIEVSDDTKWSVSPAIVEVGVETEITVTALTANEGEEAVTGTVTVTRTGSISEEVSLSQKVKPGEGGEVAETTITFDSTAQNYTNQQAISTVTADSNISIAFDKGSNSNAPKYFTSGTSIRVYGGNYFTVSSTTATITKISLTFGDGDGSNAITTDCGTFSSSNWTGSSQSVKFTDGGTSGNRRIQTITVTYTTGGNTGGGEGGDTPETPAPVLAVTSATTINVAAAGDVPTITYTITNPVVGQSVTASANQTWVHGFEVSSTDVTFYVDENTGAAREATVTLAYEGAESQTVTISQAAGNTGGGDVVASWKKESWSTFTTTSETYGSHTINGDLGTWTCVGCSAYENKNTQVVKDTGFKYVTLGDSVTEKAKVTSPTFATGIQGLKFKYYANNTARPVKVTIYENGAVSKTQTITPSAKNTLLSAEVTVTTTGSTYITFESTSTSRRVSIGEIEILY